MRISDWSSDVCSSDLAVSPARVGKVPVAIALAQIVTVAHVAPDRAQHVNGNVEALGRAGRARCEKHQERRIRRQQDGSRVLAPAGKHGSEAFRPVRSIGDEDGGNVESVELWAIGRVRDDKSGRACGKTRRSEEHTSELQSLMRISYA